MDVDLTKEPIRGYAHYLVSIDIKELQDNPRFLRLTEPNQDLPHIDADKTIQKARYLGRSDPHNANYICHANDLGSLLHVLMFGVKPNVSATVSNLTDSTVPDHLKPTVLRYLGQIR